MNIIDAVQTAMVDSVAIMNLERQEWLILSGGALRYKCNREAASLGPKDILSMSWITENDLIYISRAQIEVALKKLAIVEINEVNEIVGTEGFFEEIMKANYHNQKLRGENVRA
jgi:hypothetical protein